MWSLRRSQSIADELEFITTQRKPEQRQATLHPFLHDNYFPLVLPKHSAATFNR